MLEGCSIGEEARCNHEYVPRRIVGSPGLVYTSEQLEGSASIS